MKTGFTIAALASLLLQMPTSAAESKSDARADGFFGPIRSVSTRQEMQQVDWHQQDAKAAVMGISCWECEYDIEGNRVKSGQTFDGAFHGEIVRIVRDENGNVTEKVYENPDGQVYRRDILGPHGITQQVSYKNGEPDSRSTWRYDTNGHVAEFHRYENGEEVESSTTISDAGGHNKEEWEYGRSGAFSLYFVETYDAKTGLWTFTNFNQDGSVKVAVMTVGSRVLSYRQQPGEQHVYGSGFYMDPEGKTQQSYSCNPDGTCDQITSYFSGTERRRVSRVEWNDSAGVLRLAFDYEYELDPFENWTQRTVWVWSPELAERKVCERDYRTLEYWVR